MKLTYIKNWGGKISVILSILLSSQIGITQEIPHNDRITILHQQLQRAIDYGDAAQVLKITDILIKELESYRLELRGNLNSTTSNDSSIKYPESISTGARFGRELMLEESRAYRDNRNVCVVGKIRNNSRSQIVNPVYAIADFLGEDNSYLGSRATRLNLEPISPNETVSFMVLYSSPNSGFEKVKLRFQGINRERRVPLYPTTNSPTTLSISKGECQRSK